MNLDAVSFALAQISYTIKSLSKSNYKNALVEISNLISEYGFEAERHFYRTLITHLDLQSIDEIKRSDNIHLNYWLQEIPSLFSKTNFVTLICYAIDSTITQKSIKLPLSSTNDYLASLCKLFQFNHGQELIFALALQNSSHSELRTLAHDYFEKRLNDLFQIIIHAGDNTLRETGLLDLSIELLHTLLIQIRSYISSESSGEQHEQLLHLLRKEYPIERIGHNGSVILLPILYSSNSIIKDLTNGQLLSDSNHLSTNVRQMEGNLSDVILEMGYDFTGSVEDCRNALVYFGLQELKPSTIARMISAMIKTHSGLQENTRIYDANSGDLLPTTTNEKHSSPTWNVDTFVIAINDLVPTVNWKDVVKELDHPGFMVRDRQALVLLVTALRRALPTEQYIDLLYGRWNNAEGQLSWLAQAIRYPDVFCFGDYPAHPVLIDCLKHPLDDTKETWTWRSLKLIECLLRIADTGLYPVVLDIFKHGIQRSGELIFLGLLQLHTIWTTLKQELLQLIIPSFLANSPNANPLLNYMWNSQHHTSALRTTLLTSLADWYNRSNDNEQQQRLSRVLEIVQDFKALLVLLAAQPIPFILDLACLASRRAYLKLDKWLTDKLREHQDLLIQTTVQYLRKKAPQLTQKFSKDDLNMKTIANIETINILLTVLQIALPSLTNADLIHEIQLMISNGKLINNFNPSRSESFHPALAHPFTPSPTNGPSLTSQLRSLPSLNSNDSSNMTEISDVDVYFKRLYSKTLNPPPISVDEFLDIMAKCKDSSILKEREVFQNGIKNLFEEYKFYGQYPERELLLTAQLFGGLFERGLFPSRILIEAFRLILEGLKKPVGTNLWNFAVAALDRCKSRIREQAPLLQAVKNLPNYSDFPASIRDYFDYNPKMTLPPAFDPLRTLTPTSNLPPQPPVASPQPQTFSRMTSGPAITTNPQQFGKENPVQAGPSLIQNANIRTLINDPSYSLVRIKQPPEHINDKIAFTFNNLSFSNLTQKAQELKEVLNNDEQLWKWVAQYLVIKRVSLEHNFHSLYAGFLNTINMTVLFDSVLIETHRNIKILLLSDKQMSNIPDRTLLKNLGHWLGIITIGRNKPIFATDLEIKSIIIEAYHMGPQELLYIIPFVSKILESCAKSKIFQQPNPWLMGIMSVLAEMHGIPDFKLNLKFEIEVLCKHLEIQLNELPIHHILINKEYFDKCEKQLTPPVAAIPAPIPDAPSTQQAPPITTAPEPKYRLSDFKSSTFQSLTTMLKINLNLPLLRLHPQLRTHIYTPIEQAITESFQTIQRSLKVSTTAAENIVRKDFLLNPDEQQLRTSARNMVAYLSSGLVLITARSTLQDQIQNNIKTHFLTVLGSTVANDQSTLDSIQQTAVEIATTNIELCCCLLQRITISRAIQLIDQRLASEIELRQRCRNEGRQLTVNETVNDERLPEQIRAHYGPFSSHQLAIYEDFVHYIPGFKPNDSEKRDLATMEENVPPVWDRLVSEIEQTMQNQHNPLFTTAFQRLLEGINVLRPTLQNQMITNASHAALANLLNIILYNFLECFTFQIQLQQDNDILERFKSIHMNILKLLLEIRLSLPVITKHLTKSWLECSNEVKFNVLAVQHLIRNRLLETRQIDGHLSQLIDSGSSSALHFAVNFLRTCVIEQPCCSDNEIPLILDSLHRISLIGKQPAEAVRDLLEIIRLNYTPLTDSNENKIDKLAILSLSVINNGMKYLSIDDIATATIVSKAKMILNDWIVATINQTNRIKQQQVFQESFNQMSQEGIFRSDDTIAKFLRMTIQLCVTNVYDIVRQSSSNNQQPQYIRCHQGIDSLCRFLYLLTIHTSDNNSYGARIHLINCILGLLAALCVLDHEEQGDQFHPLAYQRILLNLFQDSTNGVQLNTTTTPPADTTPSTTNEQMMYYIYLAFTNCLHLLRPQRVTGFAFAWLEIVAHRTFMSRYLLSTSRFTRQIQNMYSILLVDALRLVAPFIRAGENTQSFQVYYKGILKTFMLLLHDFPEFLCEHYYEFCDALPLISHQLRNIILSSFPKSIRCPDPFKVNIKIDMLNDISTTPTICYNYSMNIQPGKFKSNLDSYLRSRAPVTFLSELRSYLQQGADPGSRYNIRMLNALVLYVATQALATINNKQPLMSSITHTAHMDIFQNLAVDLDTEGRYLFLNAMANHLRYPNTHTHYFSYTILYLFAEANSEALQEQIVRVLLERLVANRPHPWGLLVTFLELVRNPNLKLWSREFINISPDVKRLLTTLTHGFPQYPNSSVSNQQSSTIVKP